MKDSQTQSSQERRRSNWLGNNYLQPHFLICVVLLAVTGSTMSFMIEYLGIVLKKEPISLKQSLDLLDSFDLAPYKIVQKGKIENADIVESLGTQDYLEWVLEDTQAEEDSPARFCSLFITYYGKPDRVPHVPEECYTGGGHQQVESEAFTIELNNPEGGSSTHSVPVRCLLFTSVNSALFSNTDKFPVLYVFNVNGAYTNSREETRLVLNGNIFGKHSYFSKVEWKFFNNKFNTSVYPDKQQAVKASKKLLNVLLPILEKNYWPDL